MDERQAIARLQAGDIAALDTLVELFYVRAVRAAVLVTRDRPLAEDVVQAAFLRAYERRAQFDPARPFAPWFLRIVVNDAVKAVTRRPTLSLDAFDGEDEPGDMVNPGPDPLRQLEQAETAGDGPGRAGRPAAGAAGGGRAALLPGVQRAGDRGRAGRPGGHGQVAAARGAAQVTRAAGDAALKAHLTPRPPLHTMERGR